MLPRHDPILIRVSLSVGLWQMPCLRTRIEAHGWRADNEPVELNLAAATGGALELLELDVDTRSQ